MFETTNVRRVVIIVDASLKDQLLEKLIGLGARGYNTVDCGGHGTHAISGDPFTSDELVRIEVIASFVVAAAILDYIHAVQFQQFGHYALSAFSDTVEVDVRDRSLYGNGMPES
jgi:hypothetical protein